MWDGARTPRHNAHAHSHTYISMHDYDVTFINESLLVERDGDGGGDGYQQDVKQQ